MSNPRSTFDSTADAAYFPIAPSINPGDSVENVEVERTQGSIILDFDASGRLLGVEVLGARALLTAPTIAGLKPL